MCPMKQNPQSPKIPEDISNAIKKFMIKIDMNNCQKICGDHFQQC